MNIWEKLLPKSWSMIMNSLIQGRFFKTFVMTMVFIVFCAVPCFAAEASPSVALSTKESLSISRSIDISNYDLTTPSGLSEAELSSALKGKLKKDANLFITAEKETGVNAVFLASLAALESGWGEHPNSKNNLFGWGGSTYYQNPSDSIISIAKKIKRLYLSEEGRYFKGYTIRDVNYYYNGREAWANRMEKMMTNILQDIQLTKEEKSDIINLEKERKSNFLIGLEISGILIENC